MTTIIQTPTPNLSASKGFYDQLNFKVLSEDQPTLVSDGKIIIEINPTPTARAGIKMYNSSWKSIVRKIESLTAVTKTDEGYLLGDATGTWIYLIETNNIPNYDLTGIESSTLGNCAGLSLETTHIQLSINIWEALGFKKTMGGLEQGWIAFENEAGFGVSLMKPNSCPHLFFNPSLTYFNGKDNLAIIEKIRQANVPITEEITVFNKEGIVDNVIIRDPGGLGFFIFSD